MRRGVKLAIVTAVVVAVGAAGVGVVLGGGDNAQPQPPPTAPVSAGTETVARGDIAAVVSVDATVIANAEYVVVAPKDGVVSHVFDPATAVPARRVPPVHTGPSAALDPTDPEPTPTPTPTPQPSDEPTPGAPEEPDDTAKPDEEPTASGPVPVAAKRVLATIGGTNVTAPVDGVFTEWLVPNGTSVKKGVPIARLTYTGFALVGNLPAVDVYRLLSGTLSATAGIIDGPSGFDCRLLQSPTAEPSADRAGPSVVCAPVGDVRLFDGLPGLIAIHSGQREDVLTLPVTAVSGTAELGEVTLINDDGTTEIRTVTLGATDGIVVEIVDGLTEGDIVSADAPPLVR